MSELPDRLALQRRFEAPGLVATTLACAALLLLGVEHAMDRDLHSIATLGLVVALGLVALHRYTRMATLGTLHLHPTYGEARDTRRGTEVARCLRLGGPELPSMAGWGTRLLHLIWPEVTRAPRFVRAVILQRVESLLVLFTISLTYCWIMAGARSPGARDLLSVGLLLTMRPVFRLPGAARLSIGHWLAPFLLGALGLIATAASDLEWVTDVVEPFHPQLLLVVLLLAGLAVSFALLFVASHHAQLRECTVPTEKRRVVSMYGQPGHAYLAARDAADQARVGELANTVYVDETPVCKGNAFRGRLLVETGLAFEGDAGQAPTISSSLAVPSLRALLVADTLAAGLDLLGLGFVVAAALEPSLPSFFRVSLGAGLIVIANRLFRGVTPFYGRFDLASRAIDFEMSGIAQQATAGIGNRVDGHLAGELSFLDLQGIRTSAWSARLITTIFVGSGAGFELRGVDADDAIAEDTLEAVAHAAHNMRIVVAPQAAEDFERARSVAQLESLFPTQRPALPSSPADVAGALPPRLKSV
jgi:hypothetical protein